MNYDEYHAKRAELAAERAAARDRKNAVIAEIRQQGEAKRLAARAGEPATPTEPEPEPELEPEASTEPVIVTNFDFDLTESDNSDGGQ